MKLFKKPAAVKQEIGLLKQDEKPRREDRGTVSNFFHGAPPLSQAEADDLGFTVNVNHLYGYKDLSDASDQLFGLYTKPATLIEVQLDRAEGGKAAEWGMKIAAAASRVLKKIKPFKTAFQGIAGDAAMHGEALFFFPNKTFPLPNQAPLSRMLIPSDSSTDTRELSHFAIEKPLTVAQLARFHKCNDGFWKKEAIGKRLERIFKEGGGKSEAFDPNNLEEMEYRRQENSNSGTRRRPGADVVYFYQQRSDKPGCPYDLTITFDGEDESSGQEDSLIYQRECYIDNIGETLHPFFLDCILGGAPKWHRVLGTGTLNYQLNHAVELLVNRLQQATMEGSMNMWHAKDTATRDAAQQILMKHNGIIPEGLNLIERRTPANLSGILETIQFFRQAGSKNSRGVTPNNGDQNDMLEVQAIAEMNQGAAGVNNRMSNFYDYMDSMWDEAVARLANPCILPGDPGYSEAMDFQGEMQREGIPLKYIQRPNITVRAVRIIGDGARHKELQAVQYLSANRNQFAPEVQPKITRLCTGMALDNYKLAEELTPMEEVSDNKQQTRIDSENASMLMMRKEKKPTADDIDELHVMGHFPALERLLSDALQYQKGAFLPQQAEAFLIIGGHVKTHIDRIEGRALNNRDDPERAKAREFNDQLNQAAAMGQKMINQMEQMQEGQQEEMDPIEMARMQLEFEKFQLAREKAALAREKFERTQNSKEQKEAFQQNLQLENNRLMQIKDRREAARDAREATHKDVELAVKVATANKKPSNGSR